MGKKKLFNKEAQNVLCKDPAWQSWHGFSYNSPSPERKKTGAHHTFPRYGTGLQQEQFVSGYVHDLINATKPHLIGHERWVTEIALRQVYFARQETDAAQTVAHAFSLPQEMPTIIAYLATFKEIRNARLLRGAAANITGYKSFEKLRGVVDLFLGSPFLAVKPPVVPAAVRKILSKEFQP